MELPTRIEKLLEEKIAHDIPTRECALLLSGGVDSISVGFAADRLGKEITAYSFQLKDNPTHDISTAKNVSQIMGWNFVGIVSTAA